MMASCSGLQHADVKDLEGVEVGEEALIVMVVHGLIIVTILIADHSIIVTIVTVKAIAAAPIIVIVIIPLVIFKLKGDSCSTSGM